MRIITVVTFFFFNIFTIGAQEKVVEWSIDKKELDAQTVEVILTATIDKGWKMYSQHTPEGGPIPTEITFESIGDIKLVGEVRESLNAETKRSDLFEIDVTSFMDKATFTQVVKLGNESRTLMTKVRYMCCDGLKCIPPTIEEFSIEL